MKQSMSALAIPQRLCSRIKHSQRFELHWTLPGKLLSRAMFQQLNQTY